MKLCTVTCLIAFCVVGCLGATEKPFSLNKPRAGDNNGSLFAVVTNGDVTDFGWSYIVNAGRVAMERMLNVSGTQWITDVNSEEEAMVAMTKLVQSGMRVICSATNYHGKAPTRMANLYPNVSFAQFGGSSPLPNLSSSSFSGSDLFFALGAFAGATSPTGRVGFIHPGGGFGVTNAFYAGVRLANPNATLFVYSTNAYDDSDRAAGASDILLAEPYSVTAISGHQDDYTVPTKAMSAGLLGIGVTGYSLSNLYGQQAGVSVVRDWSKMFAGFSTPLFNASNFGKKAISGTFLNGGQYLDAPSYRVTPEQWAIVRNATNSLMVPGKTPYYCVAGIYDTWGLNPTTGCLANTSLFSRGLIPGVQYLGNYTVPLELVGFPEAITAAVVSITAVCIFGLAMAVIGLLVFRKNATLLAGSIYFMRIMLVGCALLYAGTIAWALPPTQNLCKARVWLPSVGAILVVGALLIKNVRLYILFKYASSAKRDFVQYLKNYILTIPLLAILGIDILLLGLREYYGADTLHQVQGTEGLTKYQIRQDCADESDTASDFLYAILAYHLALFVFGSILSFLLRNVSSEEHEERGPVAYTTYIGSLTLVVGGGLALATNLEQNQLIVLVCICLLFATTSTVLIVVGSRFVNAFASKVTIFHQIKVRFTRNTSTTNTNSYSTDVDQSPGRPTPSRKSDRMELA